ncbi:MAG: Flp pilus assembly complex ATPase component TadA, partial [Desulfobacterales bacterium]|nr:Flp pilus assembly complex ATPase component TadA [Desulfobacterales bacterium]
TYKILFVDDEENVLKAMCRIFRRENYTLLTANSGAEALELLQKEPVHVVISDHQMPGMTGADLLRKIKELYPQTIRIMLTGHADVNAIMGAVNEGAVYKFITKPWNDDDLRLTVSLALEQYDLIRENVSLKKQRESQEKKIKQLSRFVNLNRSQLGRILLRRKLIRKEALDKAMAAQAKNNKILPRILIEMGIVNEATIMKTIQSELGINRVYPNEFTVPKELALLIPKEICNKNVLVPLKRADAQLIVAMADPTDYMKVDDLKFMAGLPIQPVLATQKEITDKLQELYGKDDPLEAVLSEIDVSDPVDTIEIILDEDEEESDIEELLRAKDQPPAIRIVNSIISDALRHNASDVHIEPKTKYVMVRYRIDGLLHDKIHIPLSMHPLIVSRIKIMCELDIAERRRPQDGRVTVKTSSKMVDMRISTLPTITGEKVVLRILDKNAAIKDIEELGLSEGDLGKISRLVLQPQGIILSTGPTGSGKTTTLYSLLRHVATAIKNFTTIEDPVEYFMSMAGQVLVREKIGLRFPDVLRALLRQDPDVIMLGEIRDFETAEVVL